MADAAAVLKSLLAAAHMITPDAMPGLVRSHARMLGADDAVMYLVNLDQRWLVPLAEPGDPGLDPVAVDGTLAGRCFRSVTILRAPHDGETVVWVPALDGTDRLGVVQFVFASDTRFDIKDLKAFAGLLGELIMSKSAYGDFFELARRRQAITVGSELLWQLLPPLTFGTEDLVIAAAVLTAERLGGDAFDFGVDHAHAQVAVFDAVGHDLRAGLLATAAVAAFRNARRSRMDLAATAGHIGAAIGDNFSGSDFVTGILSSLETATGRFSWCIAGHPAPLLVRHGKVVKHLDNGRGQPFGIGSCSEVWTEQLEPGDRVLLYTDGVIEARDRSGRLFELDTLIDLISRTSETDPPPETMRLLMHAIEEHSHGPLRDDATVVAIEWRGQGVDRLKM